MDIIKSYNDLCEEIEIWKLRIQTYISEYRAIANMAKLNGPSDISAINYSRPAVKTSGQMGLEEALIRMEKIKYRINLHTEIIEELENTKKKIEERVQNLEGLDKKVVYLRDIKGKKLIDISRELGYSYDYIREISGRNKNPHITHRQG